MTDISPETHLDVFLRATRIVGTRLAQAFAEAGAVRPREASILVALNRAPDLRLRIDELSRELIIEKSTVSRVVERLVRAGHVERQTSGHDRRAVYAAITSQGRNALREVTRVFRAAFDDVFLGDLSPEELGQLTALLERLYSANARSQQADESGSPSDVSAKTVLA